MAQALGPIDMAKIAIASGNSSYVVVEVENNGYSMRWQAQFPSLNEEQLQAVATQNATFLEYATRAEAVAAFERLTADCGEASIGVVTGTITFVALPYDQDDGDDVVSWELDEEFRPVWQGREWRHEQIAARI